MRSSILDILKKHIPQKAMNYCFHLYQENPFHLKVVRSRTSKLGDYRFDPRDKSHTITLNHNLNPYQFLITYLHEFAHLVVNDRYGRSVAPHGKEWKSTFQDYLTDLLALDCLPEDLEEPFLKYTADPKASTASSYELMKALKNYDKGGYNTTLADIADGETFQFKGRRFTKVKTNRTRALCLDLQNHREYSVHLMAEIEL